MELHKVNVARRAEALVLAQAKRDSEAKHAQFEQDTLRDFDAGPFGKIDRDELYAASSSFVGGSGGDVFCSEHSETIFGYFNSLPEARPSEAKPEVPPKALPPEFLPVPPDPVLGEVLLPPLCEVGDFVQVYSVTNPGFLLRLATGFPAGVVERYDFATRTYTVKPADGVEFGRALTKIPYFSVVGACLDGSSGGWQAVWTFRRGAKVMLSSQGKRLEVEAKAGKRKAEGAFAEVKERMEAHLAASDVRVAKEVKKTTVAVGEQRRDNAKAAKLEVEMGALSTGDPKDPALTSEAKSSPRP